MDLVVWKIFAVATVFPWLPLELAGSAHPLTPEIKPPLARCELIFCFSLFTISHFLQLRLNHPSWVSKELLSYFFPQFTTLFWSVVITMAFGGEDRQPWTGLYLVTWARDRRSTSVIVVSSENDSETHGGVIDKTPLSLVHINTDSISPLSTHYKRLQSFAPVHRSYVDSTHAFISQQ